MDRNELPEQMTAEDIKSFLNIGRIQTYELIKNGKIPTVKAGRRIFISKKTFLDWFDGPDS
ncbi:helix-turn-helix domain-containing protein [Paenibacillus oryzisoli]|uniref:helix-turn-helix domain-containing protein n=1 Tax=Paenibacillus oryzisoli TaxID=1850517 RepID=UPI003D281548